MLYFYHFQKACLENRICLLWKLVRDNCWLTVVKSSGQKNVNYGLGKCKGGKPSSNLFISLTATFQNKTRNLFITGYIEIIDVLFVPSVCNQSIMPNNNQIRGFPAK